MYYLLRSRLHLRLPMTPAFTVIYTYHELPCQLHLIRIIPSSALQPGSCPDPKTWPSFMSFWFHLVSFISSAPYQFVLHPGAVDLILLPICGASELSTYWHYL